MVKPGETPSLSKTSCTFWTCCTCCWAYCTCCTCVTWHLGCARAPGTAGTAGTAGSGGCGAVGFDFDADTSEVHRSERSWEAFADLKPNKAWEVWESGWKMFDSNKFISILLNVLHSNSEYLSAWSNKQLVQLGTTRCPDSGQWPVWGCHWVDSNRVLGGNQRQLRINVTNPRPNKPVACCKSESNPWMVCVFFWAAAAAEIERKVPSPTCTREICWLLINRHVVTVGR